MTPAFLSGLLAATALESTALAEIPIPPEVRAGLCTTCRHTRLVRSDRGSVFYQCRLSFTDPRFVPYPRLPVLRCDGFESGAGKADAATDDARTS